MISSLDSRPSIAKFKDERGIREPGLSPVGLVC